MIPESHTWPQFTEQFVIMMMIIFYLFFPHSKTNSFSFLNRLKIKIVFNLNLVFPGFFCLVCFFMCVYVCVVVCVVFSAT